VVKLSRINWENKKISAKWSRKNSTTILRRRGQIKNEYCKENK